MTKTTLAMLTLAAASAWHTAQAQQSPVPVAPAASAASAATAPTSPTARAMEGAKPRGDIRPEKPVLPQVAVPLKRGEPDPSTTRAGRPVKSSGTVKDEAARCLAARDATSTTDCRASNGR